MSWELLQLGCDVVAAGCSLMAAMGLVACLGCLFVSIAFVTAATSGNRKQPHQQQPHARLVSRKLKPSIKSSSSSSIVS
jgi:protein gp37